MRHSIRIPLLAIGAIVGYGFAFGSMFHHRRHRDGWERHVADVCVGAAHKVNGDSVKADPVKPDKATPKMESTEP
jgi:hypothetical protein